MIHARSYMEDRMSEPTPVALRPHHDYRSWTTTWYDEQGHRRTKRFGREDEVSRLEANSRYQNWLSNEYASKPHVRNPSDPSILTVDAFADAYERNAERVFVKDGEPTGHMSNVHYGMEALKEKYGPRPLSSVDYPKIVALVKSMVKGKEGQTLSIKTVNGRLGCIKAAFKWARGQDWVTAVQLNDVCSVPSLRPRRSEARDSKAVRPVDDVVIEETRQHLPPTVRDMIDVQLLAHMRPGEVCIMRPCDIEITGDVWVYRPESHKTEHKGKLRQIPLGPKAQKIIKPRLSGRLTTDYLFSPSEAQAERGCKGRTGYNVRYDNQSYRKAIRYACKAARKVKGQEKFPIWAPNQLRHSAGTKTRASEGYAASVDLLGHSAPSTTAIYAEWSLERAKELARKVG